MVDLIDETYIAADPRVVAAAVHEPRLWQELCPGLEMRVFEDRGEAGLRFTVTGSLVGSNEIWLEPWGPGVIVHYYCRADPTRRRTTTEPVVLSGRARERRSVRATQRHARTVKAAVHALKDRLEAGR